MHLATDSVSGGSMSEAWLRTVTAVNLAPGRRYHHTVTRIARPAAERTEVRAAADWLSAELDYPTIDTVANTIFPQAVAETSDDHEELTDRYRAMYDTIRALDKANRKGTYFGRLVSYPTERGSHDQLAELIRKLNVEISLPGPKSARYEIGTDVPGGADGDEIPSEPEGCHSVPVYAVERDRSPMGFPCLSFCSFQLDGDALHMIAHYRRQHLIERGYGNYLGLARLLRHVSEAVGLQLGQLMVVAGVVTVDAPKYRIAQLQTRTQPST